MSEANQKVEALPFMGGLPPEGGLAAPIASPRAQVEEEPEGQNRESVRRDASDSTWHATLCATV